MPISVTCECGARLEIDEKFLGKEIPCPDCGKPLPTTAPSKPPPLDLPNHRRLSGLAILSLALSIVGLFLYFIVSLAGIGIGLWAMRVIKHSKKLDGLNLARAGVIVGSVGVLATLVVMITPLGLDGFLREFAYPHRVNAANTQIESPNGELVIKRPGTGQWATITNLQDLRESDDLIAVNVAANAFIACQHVDKDLFDDDEAIRTKVKDRLSKSELVRMLGRFNGAPPPEATMVSQKKHDDGSFEMVLDMRLGRTDRRFLVLYKAPKAARINYLVGCAPVSRFDSIQAEFRDAFSGFTNK